MTDIEKRDDNENIPVTVAMLCLISAIQHHAKAYINESIVSRELNLPEPESYLDRCKKLFTGQYAESAKAIGLPLNNITFKTILSVQLTDDMNMMEPNALKSEFIFNPWTGIKKITPEPSHKPKM